MRALVDASRIQSFMHELGCLASSPAQVYLAGGASAVLLDWRQSTIDIDFKLVPDSDALLRAIPALKERLRINVELASPADFIPIREGWQDRSVFVADGPSRRSSHSCIAFQRSTPRASGRRWSERWLHLATRPNLARFASMR